MLTIPPALQARLDSGATTLAHAWILRRRDGTVLGFTDHDRDLIVDGTVCRAGTGFTASEASAKFGLAVDGAELGGALDDSALREADLAAGRYDAATVESWLVDWSAPDLCVLTARGTIGEIRRDGTAFTAELRGPADALAQETGRLYTARCGADLGDGRCRVDLASPAWRGSGTVAAVRGANAFDAAGLDAFAAALFDGGRIAFTAGANAGSAGEIKLHRLAGSQVRLTLWQTMAEPLGVGDAFVVTAGCDKAFATCRERFANALNFRGFPHIPGNDFLIAAPDVGASVGVADSKA